MMEFAWFLLYFIYLFAYFFLWAVAAEYPLGPLLNLLLKTLSESKFRDTLLDLNNTIILYSTSLYSWTRALKLH